MTRGAKDKDTTPPPVVMQLENERSRVVVDGKRTDDGARCTFVVVAEVGGTWTFYPHGAEQLGVRGGAAGGGEGG